MGFRGREITYADDDLVVLLVGDSEVYAAMLPFEQMPERHLEQELRKYRPDVRVFSIADMGYGQDQQLLALKKYFSAYRADLVVLMLTARNDVENNIFPASGLNNTLKPTFWLENGEFQEPVEEWLQAIGPRLKMTLLWRTHIGKTMGESLFQKWERDILPMPYKPLDKYEGLVDYTWQKGWASSVKLAFKGIESEISTVGMHFTPRSKRREYGIELTRFLFSEIKKTTEANGGHFIILKAERPWEVKNSETEKAFFLQGKYFRTSIKQYKNNLKELLDGYEHYRIPLNMENFTISEDNAHLNEKALRKIMQDLSLIMSKEEYFKVK